MSLKNCYDSMLDFLDLLDIFDIIGDSSDVADITTEVTDVVESATAVSDIGDISETVDSSGVCDIVNDTKTSHSYDDMKYGCSVSFGSQKATLESLGGQHLEATIEKKTGSSNLYCIITRKGTEIVSGGTEKVKIDGIVYKLPKLKG